jgi:PAS domain-containing protein
MIRIGFKTSREDGTMSKKESYAELSKKVKALEKTESALRESEKLYRSLFENAPIGIGIADRNGNLIDFNEAVLKPGAYHSEDIFKIKNIKKLCGYP